MCIVFVAAGLHPDFPLVVAANRDEFITRPVRPPPSHKQCVEGERGEILR